MARVTGAELLRSLRAEADRVAGISDRLREAVATVADPTAAEVEVEAVRAAAEQRAAEEGQFRAEADAAAEEMAAQGVHDRHGGIRAGWLRIASLFRGRKTHVLAADVAMRSLTDGPRELREASVIQEQ